MVAENYLLGGVSISIGGFLKILNWRDVACEFSSAGVAADSVLSAYTVRRTLFASVFVPGQAYLFRVDLTRYRPDFCYF